MLAAEAANLVGANLATTRPVAGSAARVCEREDDDLVADDLVRQRERESIEHCDAPIPSMLPLRSRLRKSADHREHRIDLVFELLAEADLARLVVVDFVVDLGDCQPVKPEVHRRARAARRARTCSRYSSSIMNLRSGAFDIGGHRFSGGLGEIHFAAGS
jgi:hypothetical protein